MASSSAPRRGRASVAFGSEAEVCPQGQPTTHTLSLPGRHPPDAHAAAEILAARIDPTGHPPRGGDDRRRALRLVRVARRAGPPSAPPRRSHNARRRAPISRAPEPTGSSKTMRQTGLTGHLVDEHGDMPWGLADQALACLSWAAIAVAPGTRRPAARAERPIRLHVRDGAPRRRREGRPGGRAQVPQDVASHAPRSRARR